PSHRSHRAKRLSSIAAFGFKKQIGFLAARHQTSAMQVTLDLPDSLAKRLPAEPGQLASILERGLRGMWAATAGAGKEVIEFLASGPSPSAIVTFKPSAQFAERSRDLLEKNTAGRLAPEEAAELDELAQLDSLVSILKAEARKRLQQSA
ncbi:MAG TPA: hypothetical protein PK490_22690, partial [Prosthecobacter sp.]|nr:hypothetical protein [Prosthecobacter sp.]HRK17107.1 hypothetical protein [Prosthecobacter sp.]